ncbi:MAG: ABC transporter permease [Planctomycetota bacterium]
MPEAAAIAHAQPTPDPPDTAAPQLRAEPSDIGVWERTLRWLRPARAMASRDLIRFARQPTRIASAILTPLIFWAMLGFGVGSAFQPGATSALDTPVAAESTDAALADETFVEVVAAGPSYAAYLLPGAAMLMVMFTAIFATIGVIEDRREGFLQSVQVSPAPPGAIVAGKVAAASLLAVGQAAVLLTIGWLATGTLLGWPQAVLTLGTLTVAAVAFAGLGLAAAWVMKSTASYHAGMMIVLMPAWAVSGAVFPLATAPTPMQAIMLANPATYLTSINAFAVLGPEAGDLLITPWIAGPAAVAVAATSLWLARTAVARR